MSGHHTYAQCPLKSEEGVRSPRARVIDSCEPLCMGWEPNSCPLQDQQLFMSTELTLRLSLIFCNGEDCSLGELFTNELHPYTHAFLSFPPLCICVYFYFGTEFYWVAQAYVCSLGYISTTFLSPPSKCWDFRHGPPSLAHVDDP